MDDVFLALLCFVLPSLVLFSLVIVVVLAGLVFISLLIVLALALSFVLSCDYVVMVSCLVLSRLALPCLVLSCDSLLIVL